MEAQRSGSGGGGGREFHRILEELRARIADGVYPLRTYLPSQRDLATEFDVSRDTVQRVLRELAEEELVEPRRGSGSRVIKVPRSQRSSTEDGRLRGGPTLGPLLSEAFEHSEVALDVYSLTAESLAAHLTVQAERIVGKYVAPQSIALRLILPSEDLPLPYPRLRDDPADPRLADRLRLISERSMAAVHRMFMSLAEYVPDVSIEVRRAPLTPAFKLYLLNGTQALLAPYEVVPRSIKLDSGEVVDALDVLGFGAPITRLVKDTDPDSPDTLFVESWQRWFNSVWDRVAETPST
ncbi:GntR family transcriptional regulator [Streptomyces antibioticus]|uniref:GntR family transcriptional regulator n=1 Tax=Streptomyces TaxID=1883 RepID=UPI00158739F3|nr:GntR family transcriptional regulator [Streptomyces sp. CAI-85]MBO7935124.1 GntR family transcriptional regulator [Streptomyces sp. S9]NUV58695.1 GntR family transcriptional regulator [Streptomyces sp. CAI-85]